MSQIKGSRYRSWPQIGISLLLQLGEPHYATFLGHYEAGGEIVELDALRLHNR